MLTDTLVRQTKPRDKPFKLADGQGLYLFITPGGGKLWRFDYTFAGKRKTLALKSYPDVSLAAARDLREENRKSGPWPCRDGFRQASHTPVRVIAGHYCT